MPTLPAPIRDDLIDALEARSSGRSGLSPDRSRLCTARAVDAALAGDGAGLDGRRFIAISAADTAQRTNCNVGATVADWLDAYDHDDAVRAHIDGEAALIRATVLVAPDRVPTALAEARVSRRGLASYYLDTREGRTLVVAYAERDNAVGEAFAWLDCDPAGTVSVADLDRALRPDGYDLGQFPTRRDRVLAA